jgi:hypothetical protein
MEVQLKNIEKDVETMKHVVKKIRESNGTTESRLDSIEQYADTMQADLYLTMDMVRCLTDTLVDTVPPSTETKNQPETGERKEDDETDDDTEHDTTDVAQRYLYDNVTPRNPNIAAAKAAADAKTTKLARRAFQQRTKE